MTGFALTAPNIADCRTFVVDDPEQIPIHLQKLHFDLTTVLLREAIGAGLVRRNETTRASAPGAAGGTAMVRKC